jgi:hypothetical protein
MALWEYRDHELLANGRPISDLFEDGVVPSARGVAGRIADQLHSPDGPRWSYTDFYSPSRGPDPTREELKAFVARCRDAGVTLHHADGTNAP